MKKNRIAAFLVVALMLVLALSSCATQSKSEDKQDTVDPAKTLETVEYELPDVFDLSDLTEGDVEVRQVTEATKSFEIDSTCYVDFTNENMALVVPLSLINEAAENNAQIAMRYQYPEGSSQSSISFYFPVIEEYASYFPGASVEEVSLVIGDVAVTDSQSESVRSRFKQQECTVDEDAAVYSVEVGLIHETGTETTAIKLDMLMDEFMMREEGILDEEELNSRLYIDSNDAVYTINKTVYYNDASEEKNFVDSYFYGSYLSTKGSLEDADYADIEGHYAEDAIIQAQTSFNMARAITEGDFFEPDQDAKPADIFEALGTFYGIPLMDDDTFEETKQQLIEEYSIDDLYQAYFASDDDYLVNTYASRVPYGFAERYRTLAQQDELDAVLAKKPALNSRVNVALMQLGSLDDSPGILSENYTLESEPSAEEVDLWLLGITDVDSDDPLRPQVALAVHYGLIAPDADGALNLYEPITRADLCLSYVNFATLIQDLAEEDQVLPDYRQQYLRLSGENLFYDVEGLWELTEATKADGSKYTAEVIAADDATFEFQRGESLETWSDELYAATYWFSLKDRVVMLGYENGEYEPLEIDESLTKLTYHYKNENDPEFDGETYVFERW